MLESNAKALRRKFRHPDSEKERGSGAGWILDSSSVLVLSQNQMNLCDLYLFSYVPDNCCLWIK